MLDLGTTFLQSVERSPHALALVEHTLRLTYAQWHAQVARVAAGLSRLGLARGDRLLSVLQNRNEAATLHWACQFLGVVMVPINWRAKPEEVDYCIADAEVKAVVFEAVSESALQYSTGARALPRIAVGAVTSDIATHTWNDLLNVEPMALESAAEADDVSLMLYTSGTTGKPKGVPRRHRQERAAALAHVAQNLYRRGERTLGVMPLYHTMGVRSLLAMALVDGTFVCMPRFDTQGALTLIERERITCLYLVPTLYHDMLAQRQRAGGGEGPGPDLASVTKLGFAGAPMHDALLQRLQRAFEPELFVNHYGSSEVYTVAIDQDATRKAGSAGRAGLNTRLRVVRLNAKSAARSCRSPTRKARSSATCGRRGFRGLLEAPDADAKSLRDGWYFTGDTGYFDDEGDLYVTGRIDDMIISGGENISPVDIESVLSLHPRRRRGRGGGLQDERWGQRVVAFVKRSGDTRRPDARRPLPQLRPAELQASARIRVRRARSRSPRSARSCAASWSPASTKHAAPAARGLTPAERRQVQ
jgi:2-furoate---CoA ligase